MGVRERLCVQIRYESARKGATVAPGYADMSEYDSSNNSKPCIYNCQMMYLILSSFLCCQSFWQQTQRGDDDGHKASTMNTLHLKRACLLQ